MPAVQLAIAFVWLGMVLGISFLEAPLKFRAPGMTVPLGLGIGRIVFRALNTVEVVLAGVLVVALVAGHASGGVVVALGVAVVVLVVQLALVRPRLSRRSDAVLAGRDDVPRSHAHHVFVVLEVVKVVALTWGGVLLVSA